jgi:hypothetical protein
MLMTDGHFVFNPSYQCASMLTIFGKLLVLGRFFDFVDNHHGYVYPRLLQAQTELLLHGSIDIWRSVSVGYGRLTGGHCATKRTHGGIRSELQGEGVTGIPKIRLIDNWQVQKLPLQDTGKLRDRRVPAIKPPLWHAAKTRQRGLHVFFFFDLLAAFRNGYRVSLQFAFVVVELETEAIDNVATGMRLLGPEDDILCNALRDCNGLRDHDFGL